MWLQIGLIQESTRAQLGNEFVVQFPHDDIKRVLASKQRLILVCVIRSFCLQGQQRIVCRQIERHVVFDRLKEHVSGGNQKEGGLKSEMQLRPTNGPRELV